MTRDAAGGRARLAATWLGRVGYEAALVMQRDAVAARGADAAPDRLLLLEHPDVVTIGRGGTQRNVLIDDATARRLGVLVVETDRGGDVTYHGPGQLVGYPILQLHEARRDLHRYLRDVEEVLIDVLAEYGVDGARVPGRTGVWVGDEKIGAIGVRVSRWITSHGFALNVTTDLERFRWIVPCGIAGCRVTSLERLIGRRVPLPEVAAVAALALAERFGLALDADASLRIESAGALPCAGARSPHPAAVPASPVVA